MLALPSLLCMPDPDVVLVHTKSLWYLGSSDPQRAMKPITLACLAVIPLFSFLSFLFGKFKGRWGGGG